ncbi:MAG: T9SS type A sorting domain-containing protein [Chitinophagaceae bacterium]|nr:T9SS type A sorting domain-containing protein [Chitinophagaceae bacterium]
MKIFQLSLIATLLGLGAFLLLEKPVKQELEPEAQEESELRTAWEHKMLADPATGEIPKGIQYLERIFLNHMLETSNANHKKYRGATWTSRGPWNVGGRTRTIAIDVTNENHIIAGAVSGGIWESMDAGATWTRVSDPLGHPGVVSISQDTRPGKTNLWYALSGEIYGTSASGGSAFYLGDGAFFSDDNGHTWTPLASTAGGNPSGFSTLFQGGWRIATSPVDSVATCIYMACYGSVLRSVDTGKTWKTVVGVGNDSYFSDVAVSSEGIVYAALSSDGVSSRGFFRSADGVNFTNITPAFLKSYDRVVLCINPNDENEVYFLGELPSDTSGGVTTYNYEMTPEYVALVKYKYISGDGTGAGGQWTNLSANLPVNSPNQFDKFNTQGGYDLLVRCQKGSNTIVVGGTNLYRSTDGFTSPNNTIQIGGYGLGTKLGNFVTFPNHHPDQHDLIFLNSDPKKAYSVSDGGVKFTNNLNATDISWEEKSLGYITSQFYCVNIDESKPFDQWILGGLQDNGNYIANSNTPTRKWKMTINGDGAFSYIAPNRSFYVISTQLGNIRKVQLDENGNVLQKRRIDPAGYDKSMYGFINPFIVDPVDNNFLYLPIGKKLARLNNLRSIPINGDTSKLASGWTFFPDTITTPKLTSGSSSTEAEITAIAVSQNPAHTVYFGTSNREMYRIDNAHNGSPSFVKLSTLRLPNNGYVSDIAIDPDSAKNVLICYSNYNVTSLFYSNDTGKNWYLVGGNVDLQTFNTGTPPSVRSVAILKKPNGQRIYFAGTSIGLFSADTLVLALTSGTNKTNWDMESPDGIGANVVTDIKTRHSDGYVVAATHGNGVYESYFTGNTPPPPFNTTNSLELYPNPAVDEIYYTFNITNTASVRADIIDMSGRRVRNVLNGSYNIGTYTLKTSVSGLTNGHYFLSLYTTDGQRPQAKHFIVLK